MGPSIPEPAAPGRRAPSCSKHGGSMKILFVASEVAPYSKSGGLGDVAHALPKALAARGHEVRVVTPLYASARVPNAEDSGQSIRLRFPFGERRASIRVARLAPRHQVWFLDNPRVYARPR